MDFAGYRYYKLNHILLSCIKLWAYNDTFNERVQGFICYLILISGVVVQIVPFLTDFRLSLFLKSLPYIIFTFIFIVKYHSFYFNLDKIKVLLDRMQYDWNTFTNEEESEILEKYANNGRLFTVLFALSTYPAIIVFSLSQFLPVILNIVIPLNESRTFEIPTHVEYFVDQKKYLYFIVLHLDIVGLAGVTATVATETMSVIFSQHSCGMFKIASSRIERALNIHVWSNSAEKRSVFQCEKLISAVEAHKRALEFTEYTKSTFITSYFLLLLLGVSAMSVNLFRLSQAVILMDDMKELLTVICAMIGQFVYLFGANYIGQDLINHSGEIFEKTYNSLWYMAPVHIQKLLLFLMQKSIKPYVIVIGGIYVPCFEGFSAVSSASLSYFMVIYSTQ